MALEMDFSAQWIGILLLFTQRFPGFYSLSS